jgi:endonuclease-3
MSETPDDDGDTPSVAYCAPDDTLGSVVGDPAAGGTYVLCFAFEGPTDVTVGALGRVGIPAGDYAYVGSAFGPGGFARVDRHRRHLSGDDDTVHWHIDALTTRSEATLVGVVLCPTRDVECAVAARLPPGPIDGFGSSDCRCRSHLSRVDRDAVVNVVDDVVRRADAP